MDAHFEWAETGVVPPEDKSYEFIDFFSECYRLFGTFSEE